MATTRARSSEPGAVDNEVRIARITRAASKLVSKDRGVPILSYNAPTLSGLSSLIFSSLSKELFVISKSYVGAAVENGLAGRILRAGM